MKTTRVAGALAALLVAGCSASAPVNAPPAGTASSPAVATSAPAPAPAGGQEIDPTTFLQSIAQGQAFVKTSITTVDGSTTAAGKTTVIKTMVVADRTDPSHIVAQTTTDLGGTSFNMIIDGDVYYMQMGGVWFKLNKESFKASGGTIPDLTDQSAQLKNMSGKIQKVVLVGDETIDGVATKHYLLTLDGSALSALETGTTGASAAPTVAPITLPIPYDMWVDGNSILRKFAVTLKQDTGDFVMTGAVTKINEPVTIEIPKNAQAFPGK